MAHDRVVDAYYEDVKDVELLNADLERRLFAQYRTCAGCEHTYTEGALQKRCPACDKPRNFRAREKLVEGALRFVVKVARDYARRARGDRHSEELLLALISAGNLGLLVAVDRFQTAKGTRFLTYAAWWVREKILEELDNMGVVRVPAYQQKAQRARWKQATGEMEAPYVTLEPLTELERGRGDEATERRLLDKYGVEAVNRALRKAGVSPQEQYALMVSLGAREDPRSLRQVAARLGYSLERVRALRRESLNTLRGVLTDLDVSTLSDVFA